MREINIDRSKNYSKVSTYYLANKTLVFFLNLTGLCFDGLMSFVPVQLGKLIDLYAAGNEATTILQSALIFILLVCFVQINRFFKRYLVRVFSNRTLYTMRKVSFNYIVHSPLEKIESASKGDLLNRSMADISDATEGLRKITTEIFDTFVLLIGYAISLFIMNWRITLISLGFITVSILVAASVKKLVYSANKAYKQFLSKTKDGAIYTIRNEPYYRGLGVTSFYEEKFNKEQNYLEKLAVKSMLLNSSLQPIYLIISWLSLVFILWLGGVDVQASWPIGTFSAYLTTYMLVSTKIGNVGKLVNAFQSFKVSWERCKIYLKHPIEKKLNDGSNSSTASLIVKNMSFGFSEQETIHDVSFTMKPGEIIGVCGRVHSGKSTLLQALNGLYDYSGSIKLYGSEVKDLPWSERKESIGFCSSSIQLFKDSLENNIALGAKESVSDSLYISDLENDLKSKQDETKIELNRSIANLSGGQQNRLMIARAVFSKPKLIILDNPFEGIDEEMSIEIIRRIKEKLPQSMVILVSNQERILKQCDQLLLIDNWKTTIIDVIDIKKTGLFSDFNNEKSSN
jgi:ATP-binding cassette subfamily B multidrug efflux pump